jgi:BirA family biotin operon repressor/biotin-[acetyl-CoA-carboxylase] ligase
MSVAWRVVRFETVGSTMDVAGERARAGEAEGLVVVADEQTNGRGRAGRVWTAPRGGGLLCSILLRPPLSPVRLGTLPLTVGVAVAETIDAFVPSRCQVKWPNDVLLMGRKTSGVLLQSRLSATGIDFLTLGIGINVAIAPDTLPEGATSILAAGGSADRVDVLDLLLANLDARYADFIATDGAPDLDPWRERAALLGERVIVERGDAALSGVFEDVERDGRLRLRLDSGERVQLSHGDVRRGPRLAGNVHATAR